MTEDFLSDIANNADLTPEPFHVPFYLLVDHSTSLKELINNVNEGMRSMLNALQKNDNPWLKNAKITLTLIDFNNNVHVNENIFRKPIEELEETALPILTLEGATDIGAPIIRAVELAKQEYAALKASYRDIYVRHPVIILFTDGVPDAGQDENGNPMPQEDQDRVETNFQTAIELIHAGEDKDFTFLCFSFQDPKDPLKAAENYQTLCQLSKYGRLRTCEKSLETGTIKQFFEDIIPSLLIEATKNPTFQCALEIL